MSRVRQLTGALAGRAVLASAGAGWDGLPAAGPGPAWGRLLPCLFGRLIPRGSGCLRGGSRLNRGRLLLRRLFGGGGEIGVKIFTWCVWVKCSNTRSSSSSSNAVMLFLGVSTYFPSSSVTSLLGAPKSLATSLTRYLIIIWQCPPPNRAGSARPMAVANPLSSVASTPTGF